MFYSVPSRRWDEGRWRPLAVWAHEEGQRFSTDCRPANQPGHSSPPSQSVASRPPIHHPVHPIHPLRHIPSSPLGVSVGGAHARGAGFIPPLRQPSHRPIPDVGGSGSSAPRMHVHPTHHSALKEATPTEAPLHPSASVPQSVASAAQHHSDAQQKPRVPAGQPHRGPAHQQVGVQEAVTELTSSSHLVFNSTMQTVLSITASLNVSVCINPSVPLF